MVALARHSGTRRCVPLFPPQPKVSRPRHSSGTTRSTEAPPRTKSPVFANHRLAGSDSPDRFVCRARLVGSATRSKTTEKSDGGASFAPMSWQGSRRTPSDALVDTPGGLDTHPLAVITRSPVANHPLRLVDRPTTTVRTSLMPYLPGLSGSGSRATSGCERSGSAAIRQVSLLTTIPAAMAAATSPAP
jgi:hypothetical protein